MILHLEEFHYDMYEVGTERYHEALLWEDKMAKQYRERYDPFIRPSSLSAVTIKSRQLHRIVSGLYDDIDKDLWCRTPQYEGDIPFVKVYKLDGTYMREPTESSTQTEYFYEKLQDRHLKEELRSAIRKSLQELDLIRPEEQNAARMKMGMDGIVKMNDYHDKPFMPYSGVVEGPEARLIHIKHLGTEPTLVMQ